MRRFVLYYRNPGPVPTRDMARVHSLLRNARVLTENDRALVVETTPATINRVLAQMSSSWIAEQADAGRARPAKGVTARAL